VHVPVVSGCNGVVVVREVDDDKSIADVTVFILILTLQYIYIIINIQTQFTLIHSIDTMTFNLKQNHFQIYYIRLKMRIITAK